MKKITCCMDCEKRVLGCHSTCEEYIRQKSIVDDKRKQEQEWRNKHYDYLFEVRKKMAKKKK